eukprot:464564_1
MSFFQKYFTQKKKKNRQKPKDIHAPKPPLSAYSLFANDNIHQLKEKQPHLMTTDVMKEITKMWDSISLNIKQKYKNEAKKVKTEYLYQIQEYKKSPQYQQYQQKLDRWQQRQNDTNSSNSNHNKSSHNNKKPKSTSKSAKKSKVKRQILEKPMCDMTKAILKKEINKRRRNNMAMSNLNKPELINFLFREIKLSPSDIDKLTDEEIINELKMNYMYDGKSSWNRKDMTDYLKHLHSSKHAFIYGYSNTSDAYDNINTHEPIPKERFITIPLFKLQHIYYEYEFKGVAKCSNHNEMYNLLQAKWEEYAQIQRDIAQREMEEKERKLAKERNKQDLLQQIKKHFFVAGKTEVLVFRGLDEAVQTSVCEWAEQQGLMTIDYKVMAVGCWSDANKIFEAVLNCKELNFDQEKNNVWNALMKQHEEWTYANNNNKNTANKTDICGEWVMNEDTSWGNKSYLFINKWKKMFYGSFLIGCIEGKMAFEEIKMNKFSFEWRGREIGENVIEIGAGKIGTITFNEQGTKAFIVIKTDYGTFKCLAYQISSDIDVSATMWDFMGDEEAMYEQERIARWHH